MITYEFARVNEIKVNIYDAIHQFFSFNKKYDQKGSFLYMFLLKILKMVKNVH